MFRRLPPPQISQRSENWAIHTTQALQLAEQAIWARARGDQVAARTYQAASERATQVACRDLNGTGGGGEVMALVKCGACGGDMRYCGHDKSPDYAVGGCALAMVALPALALSSLMKRWRRSSAA